MRILLTTATAVTVACTAPGAADAFCGFYVGGAGADLFNNATQVVMMRQGTRTVLSMQNNYQGPPQSFAMVVPVPVVLKKDNVKTLPPEIFARVDRLAAPRLVEYWEQDPCAPQYELEDMAMPVKSAATGDGDADKADDFGVTIEAKFTVAEYQIVILSAKESTGLSRWLEAEKYNIPKGAEPYLRPYVEGGSKFFVAKVDATKVKFKDGMAMLSPLRVHYDTDEFTLPIRLGMMNSSGTQDLIVHVLAQGQRYEVKNYKNVTIPTNLAVTDKTRKRFGEFYAALFDRTVEKNPGAVVTEYSWDASSCDPCPEPPLRPDELATLGGDVLGGQSYRFVLTRLHARYKKDGIEDDLVFKAATPIVGGRERMSDSGKLEDRARPGRYNNFQGRYIIRHEWTGKIECKEPVRGNWGGPPPGESGTTKAQAAVGLAFAPRGKVQLPTMVAEDVPEIGLIAAVGASPKAATFEGAPDRKDRRSRMGKGCGCNAPASGGGGGALILIGFVVFGLSARRHRASTVNRLG